MRVFIKSEHVGGDLAAPLWPATSMACKLNERASSFICLGGGGGGIAVSQSCQGCQGLSVCVLSVGFVGRSAGQKGKVHLFVYLSPCCVYHCAQLFERVPQKKKKRKIQPMYIFVWYKSSVPMSIFFPRLCLLNFSLICSRRCEVCLPMVCQPSIPSSLLCSLWFVLWLTFADWQRMSTFLAHTHTYTHVYRDYSFLLLIFIIIWSLFLLIFAYVMQQADCFSDYDAEAQLKLIELTFSWMW